MERVESTSGEAVLLVDDNPINLRILHRTLDGSGYQLLTARSGTAALELVASERPSLVLLDVMMPDLDGFEVCQRLKANPLTADIPVIFLSALDDSQAKVRGFAVGGIDYIAKPFQSDEVVARVRTHLKIHRLERALARRNVELEEETQQILNAVSEGIVGLDGAGRVTVFNPAASAITGWPSAEAIGDRLYSLHLFQSDDGFFVPEEQTLPYRAYCLGFAARSEFELVRRRDGRVVPVAMACSPRGEGGAVLVLRDISESLAHEEALRQTREELESQRQHMAHMERLSTSGEMAAGIAHEVNQPLTAVVNYVRVGQRLLAAEAPPLDKLGQLFDKIEVQAVRASDVIQRLRSYVRKPDIGRRRMAVNTLIADVVALAEVDSRINDVAIHFEFASDLPEIHVDAVQLQQVALNLIRNAMEAMVDSPHRELGVVVQTGMERGWVTFRVIDRGHGLAPGAEAQLFNPFFTTKPSGMGIGLSICQSIVQAHGGEIGCRANPEGGMTFYCHLPPVDG